MKKNCKKKKKKEKKNTQRQKGAMGTEAIVNLDLALSIILKQRELYESKHVILFDMLLNPSVKMTRSFASIARTTANTVNLYIH